MSVHSVSVLRGSLRLPAGTELKRIAENVVRIVDSVHSVGRLPTRPDVRWFAPNEVANNMGGFVSPNADGKGCAIALRRDGPTKELTLVHEIAHLLDHQGIGTPGAMASDTEPLMENWRNTVGATDVGKEWQRLLAEGTKAYTTSSGITVVLPVKDPDFVRYAAAFHELFARSYEQYIAFNRSDTVLYRQLIGKLEMQRQKQWHPEYWEPRDFEPVRAALDDLLAGLGWRTT